MQKIILLGGGGHCKVVIDTILLGKQYAIAGIADVKANVGKKVSGVTVIGTDAELEDYYRKGIKNCFIAAGSVGDPSLRIKLFKRAKQAGFKLPNIIHPRSTISKTAYLGEGNFIAAGAIINPGAEIGDNCIINTSAVIEHDCIIGDFTHIASGVILSGAVEIGEYSHLGTGACVIQSIKIGKRSVIGAGSVVVNNIGDNAIAFGNPCKKIKTNA